MRGAEQARVVTTLRSRNFHLLCRGTKCALAHLSIHFRSKQVPTIHCPTDQYNNLRIDQINQIRQTNPQIHAEASENYERKFIAISSGFEHFYRTQFLVFQNRLRKDGQVFSSHTHDRGRRSKHLQTTRVATLALHSTERIYRRVSDLTRRAMRTAP